MKKSELNEYKSVLMALSARLRGDVNHLADAALNKNGPDGRGEVSSMPIHMADLGSENFEQEFTLSLMETEEDTLDSIESALQRIEDGTYGQCEECEVPIPKTRLKAIPYTTVCVRCAQKLERG